MGTALLEDFLDAEDVSKAIQNDVHMEDDQQCRYRVCVLLDAQDIYTYTYEQMNSYKETTLTKVRALLNKDLNVEKFSKPLITTKNDFALKKFPDTFDYSETSSGIGLELEFTMDVSFRNTISVIRFFGSLYALTYTKERVNDDALCIISVWDNEGKKNQNQAICANAHLFYDIAFSHKELPEHSDTFASIFQIPQMFLPSIDTYFDCIKYSGIDQDENMLSMCVRVLNSQSNYRTKKLSVSNSFKNILNDVEISRIHAAPSKGVQVYLFAQLASKAISPGTIIPYTPSTDRHPVVIKTVKMLNERPVQIANRYRLFTSEQGSYVHFLATLGVVINDGNVYNVCISISSIAILDGVKAFVETINQMTGNAITDELTAIQTIYKAARKNG